MTDLDTGFSAAGVTGQFDYSEVLG